jgi:energy-coupling factor transporter ATP-binding protein EcfA2
MRIIYPFKDNRFELEPKGSQLYHLPKRIMEEIEQSKSVYLIGTRGTGKTTLLKALSWRERIDNKYLQDALNNDLFGKCYLGLYLKLNRHVPNHFKKWLNDDEREDEIFSLFLDLLWLEELTSAVQSLCLNKINGKRIFDASPVSEIKFVKNIFEKIPKLSVWRQPSSDYTLSCLNNVFEDMRAGLQEASMARKNVSSISDQYPYMQIGELGRSVHSMFSEFCDEHSLGSSKWYFKFCVDEAEWFSTKHERIINTMARLSEWPTFYVLSYVRSRESLGDISSTVQDNITLSEADRAVIYLDKITDQDANFFEEVASVRVKTALETKRVKFDLKKIAGSLNLNKLLRLVIEDSKNPKAKIWLKKAQSFKNSKFWSEEDDSKTGKVKRNIPDYLPIHEVYQIEKLGLDYLYEITPTDSNWESREQLLEQISGRMVAAYLCLCRELKRQDVPYAFSNMIRGMSDNCIRDFLNQIHQLHLESGLDIKTFIGKQLSLPVQHHALLTASQNKRNNIPKSRGSYPKEIGRLVDGLGKVTSDLQSDYTSTVALTSPERGLFQIEYDPNSMRDKTLIKYINDGVESGYLRMHEEQEKSYIFRLHSSVAALYKISYRGAYSRVKMNPNDLMALIEAKDDKQIVRIADRIVKAIISSSDPNQIELFESNEV